MKLADSFGCKWGIDIKIILIFKLKFIIFLIQSQKITIKRERIKMIKRLLFISTLCLCFTLSACKDAVKTEQNTTQEQNQTHRHSGKDRHCPHHDTNSTHQCSHQHEKDNNASHNCPHHKKSAKKHGEKHFPTTQNDVKDNTQEQK